mmetsp:Transcript_8015/g.14876  ORF Transcript_8015/g.14876 Transcript_8015/m.14876 type:complete len:534 (-) Transcript_8015:337-1938(-)
MKEKRQSKKKSTILNFFRKNSNQNDKQQPPHDATKNTSNPQENDPALRIDTKQNINKNTKHKHSNTKTSNGFPFPKKVKSPGGLEVQAYYHANSNNHLVDSSTSPSGGGVLYHNDDVSVMTPVTGLQPDSPDRFRRLNGLHCGFDPHPHPDSSARNDENDTNYGGAADYFYGTPSRGKGVNVNGMKVGVPVITPEDVDDDGKNNNRNYSRNNNNHTTTTGKGATGRDGGKRRRLSPPPMLLPGYDDDDNSREPSIYEDLSAVGSGNTPYYKASKASPSSQNSSSNSSMSKSNSKLTNLLQTKSSWLTQTRYFQKVVDWSFDVIDSDDSGDVSLEELYSGLLLVHLKFAVYVGAPACRPASREYVAEIFHLLDTDDSGTLTKEEFTIVMKILYSQVFTRIVIQWTLTLMIVPLVSQYVIHYSKIIYSISHDFWKNIDDDIDPLQRLFYKLWSYFLHLTPEWMDDIGRSLWNAADKIPKGIWKSMPMTILTVGQTSVLLPFALSRVEEFFRGLAYGNVGGGGRERSIPRKKLKMN